MLYHVCGIVCQKSDGAVAAARKGTSGINKLESSFLLLVIDFHPFQSMGRQFYSAKMSRSRAQALCASPPSPSAKSSPFLHLLASAPDSRISPA
jgi:hypothetical protein